MNTSLTHEQRYRETRKVTLVGSLVNCLLASVQLLAGFVGQSQALLADGIHTLSDLASDIFILVAARVSRDDADEAHPYGHGRFETLATVGLGVALLAVAAGLVWDAAHRLFRPEELLQPTLLALWAAAVGIVAKEGLYHFTRQVARRIRSKMLEANAWHHRSDAVSSVVVVIGVGGTLAGLPYLDAVAAVGVGVMIAKIGWQLVWRSARELVDTGLEREKVEAIRERILRVEGVQSLHFLRTRQLGPEALVDVHIIVDPRLTVSEGHYISERVRGQLIATFDEVSDVLVHIDPEDDEMSAPSQALPARGKLIRDLRTRWNALDAAQHIDRVSLHYIAGRVDVDVVLPLATLNGSHQAKSLHGAFSRAVRGVDGVGRVELYFH